MKQATTWLEASESPDARSRWLATTVAYLRNLLSLFALANDGWFICRQYQIIDVIRQFFPQESRLIVLLWAMKFAPIHKERFVANGKLPYSAGLDIQGLHQCCFDFASKVRGVVVAGVEKHAEMRVTEDEWLPQNIAAAQRTFHPNQLPPSSKR